MTTIDIATIRTLLDAATSTIAAVFTAGRKQQQRYIRRTTLADNLVLSSRTYAWTQDDDALLETAWLQVTDVTAGRVVTATLTVDGSDVVAEIARLLLNKTITITVTTIIGTAEAFLTNTSTAGDRVRLKRGVRYRWTILNTSAGTTTGIVHAIANLISVRRDR